MELSIVINGSNKDSNIKNIDCKDDLIFFYRNIFSILVGEKLPYSNRTHILEQTTKNDNLLRN